MVKKFVPSITLYQGNVAKSPLDLTPLDVDIADLVQNFQENNADELIVYMVAEDDASHDACLDQLKAICKVSEMNVFGAGAIKRMEDVKKILYTGCKKAILDYTNSANVAITEEVSLKFGAEKIMVMATDCQDILENLSVIEKYVSGILLLDSRMYRVMSDFVQIPVYVQSENMSLNKLMELLECPCVGGVTGNLINENVAQISALKQLCKENGLQIATLEAAFTWEELKKNSDGLVPVIVQDDRTNEVLMMAYMNEEAYLQTLSLGKMTYYSRSRNELWLKGATSGHFQYVKSLYADCDMDTILARVSQIGAACHTGSKSCFFREIAKKDYVKETNPLEVFEQVFAVIQDRKVNPKEGSYTNYLFDKGIDKILKKLGEEATEIVIAAKNPNSNEIKYEISDFLYHMMVLMAEKQVTWEDITNELANR